MRIAIGSDHAGIELRGVVVAHLRESGHEVDDLGPHSHDSVDYPDYAKKVAGRVVTDDADRGVLVCGTGQGMAMAANKVAGIRAATLWDETSAQLSRQHNDANVFSVGERLVEGELAERMLETWLATEFEGGRHQGRVDKIDALSAVGRASSP